MSVKEQTPLAATDRTTEDSLAREQALDVTRSFIVQAPAGSGKTELLIQRFLALLTTVDAPEEIVAITFTRKASAEMRVRIMQALDRAGSPAPDAEHARRTWQVANDVLRRDTELGWQLLDQPSRLRIMTIDAFNGWLTRQMPWVSAMGSQVSIVDDASDLYRDAVRAVLLDERSDARFGRELMRFLVHLDNRYYLAENLLVDMIAIRDQWIPVLYREEGSKDGAREQMEQILHHVIRQHLSQLHSDLPADMLAEAAALAHHAAATLDGTGNLSEASPLHPCLLADSPPAAAIENFPAWQGIAHLLLTSAGTLRKPRGVDKRLGFLPEDPRKQHLQELLEKLVAHSEWCDRLAAVRTLPAERYEDDQWQVLDDILQVLLLCLEQLRRLFIQRGVLDHPQMAFAAAEALGGDLTPTDLALILEYRLRHLLVDEFQDTSSTQFRLLKLLTAGWSTEDGHTLFLVGDPMQSIYRFREADVGLFLTVWEEGRMGSVPLRPLRLYKNFRSQEGLVAWVNKHFSDIMPAQNDPDLGAVAFVSATAVREKEEHGVSLEISAGGSRTDEAERVAALCQEIREHPDEFGESAAILVRSRSHILEILPRLREAGIRCQAVEIEPLGRHPAVQDILSLARALTHPGDRIAWLAVLRAPWCGLRDGDLHALAAYDQYALLPDVITDDSMLTRLTDDGRQRVIRCRAALQNAMEQRGRKSLRREVEGCWIELGGPATTDAAGLDAARCGLDLLESLSPAGVMPELEVLYNEVEQLYAPPDPGADINLQVMTIHKAKGLQFDTVIVPRLDGKPRHGERRLLLWMERRADDGHSFILAPLAPRGEDEDQTYRYIRSILARKEEHEALRLLYVAVTRARRRLLLTATVKQSDDGDNEPQVVRPAKHSFLGHLWESIEAEATAQWFTAAGSQIEATEEGIKNQSPGSVRSRLGSDWSLPEIPSFALDQTEKPDKTEAVQDSWSMRAGKQARERGVVVHQLLAHIAMQSVSWWEGLSSHAKRSIVRAGFENTAGYAQHPDIEEVLELVKGMLADERGRWILQPQHDGRCEYALTGVLQGKVVRSVIDRTFVDEHGERWIIDYKVSGHEGSNLEAFLEMHSDAHRDQLRRYTDLMQMRESRPVHAALYFPVQRAWRVLIRGSGGTPDIS